MEYNKETFKYISSTIEFWQELLNLKSWRIDWALAETLSHSRNLLEIKPTRSRHHAKIFIRTSAVDTFSKHELEQLLLHELCHLVLDPIASEHHFELEYSIEEIKREECRVRFLQVLEQTVEHTAQMLCKVLKEKERV